MPGGMGGAVPRGIPLSRSRAEIARSPREGLESASYPSFDFDCGARFTPKGNVRNARRPTKSGILDRVGGGSYALLRNKQVRPEAFRPASGQRTRLQNPDQLG